MMRSNSPAPRLLVVDDESDMAEFVGFIADNAGYNVDCISDPHDFVKAYSDDLSVIIMDLSMPDMDGIELIRYLASVNSKVGIILMSGYDASVLHSAKELADSRGLYVLGALEKPISINDLELILGGLDDLKSACKKKILTPMLTSRSDSITVDELKQAINNHEFVAYYQPKVDMVSHFLISIEALVRWNHPTKGIIMPEDFIGLAEETGLINDLTCQVLNQALADCSNLKSKGIIVKVAVNVSAKTLTDLEFPDHLQEKLIKYKLDATQLIIEVTESALSDDLSHALDILTRIRMKGIHLSIDDFGTGYSSIQMLHRGPFDELKVDRSFVSNIGVDMNAKVITEASIDLSKKLKIKVVAEGVESKKTWDSLLLMGCDEAQGYFISPAVPVEEIPHWLLHWENVQLKDLSTD